MRQIAIIYYDIFTDKFFYPRYMHRKIFFLEICNKKYTEAIFLSRFVS
jgi:hypothetical protein